ncbi:helix-turn-helix transcriptional regulator [Streptomyces sp. B-S-A8]|uniref:Helix-turn-helix transcriptional regulator n=1 Tax=Streptomyces solicavernae TaxID=3043614 RepID=A0ABT6RP15_9ACTN|nr:helix-turn-helix transcriptional regulator [Streptomyces sp. B-S-A8]MDI3386070.1 helix-turn-helix transcriptional regulator [Streptomyces sp. B-S-A8]
MYQSQAAGATPPFNNLAARRLREALGMAHGHVAYSLRASYGLSYVTPETVADWERGRTRPSSAELTALAGALWCAPGELLGAATTLREHRITRGLASQDVAREVGVEHGAYLAMEESGRWRGNERQSAALAEVLGLGLRDFITVTGREETLADLLRSAATARWEGYVRPVTKLVPLPKATVEAVLDGLHGEYHARMVATLSWGGMEAGDGASGPAFLERIVEEFWSSVRDREG